MDPQQQQLLPAAISAGCARIEGCGRRLGAAAGMTLVMLTGLISGCLPESFLIDSGPSAGAPCMIATRWEHEVRFTPDTENNGKPMPTVVGRVTLFANDLTTPVVAKGIISVYLYNDMPDAHKDDEPLEYWALDASTVQRLVKRDAAGWGYTLVLPWTSYRPELTQVRLKVRFDRAGTKDILYSTPIQITFEKPSDKPKMVFSSKQIHASAPMSAQNSQPVQDVGGGSLPTTVTLSPPPPKSAAANFGASLGNDIPFVVPPPGTVPARQ